MTVLPRSSARPRWLRLLASPLLAFYTLPWLMVLLVMGTVTQPMLGLYEAQRRFFGSFILWAGPAPLPGAYITLGLIGAGVIARLCLDWPFAWRRAGVIITHIGVLVLLAGGLATAATQREGYMALKDGESSRSVLSYDRDDEAKAQTPPQLVETLPFTIRLVHFGKDVYPGTDMARSYQSAVTVEDQGLHWPVTIEMNKPLRYRGYSLYQSSYIEKDGQLTTVLAVVHNGGAVFPYIALALLCLGLMVHIGAGRKEAA